MLNVHCSALYNHKCPFHLLLVALQITLLLLVVCSFVGSFVRSPRLLFHVFFFVFHLNNEQASVIVVIVSIYHLLYLNQPSTSTIFPIISVLIIQHTFRYWNTNQGNGNFFCENFHYIWEVSLFYWLQDGLLWKFILKDFFLGIFTIFCQQYKIWMSFKFESIG